MKTWAAFATIGLLLAGCEDGTPETNVAQVVAANPHSDQLKTMSEPMRHLGLYRALRDNGQRCKRVDRAAYRQQYKTMAMWTAHCTDSGDWAVYIAPNGDVQVSRCEHARQLGLPECSQPTAPRPRSR